jgi:hypothetical protein
MATYAVPARVFLPEEEAAPIREIFRRGQENWEFWELHWEQLLRDHYGGWVAIDDGQMLIAPNLDALFEELRAQVWPLGTALIRSLTWREPHI